MPMTSPIPFYLVTKIYIVDVVMWSKFGNSSISMGEVIITSISYDIAQKNQFF